MIITYSMEVCHTQNFTTNSQGLCHNFDSRCGHMKITHSIEVCGKQHLTPNYKFKVTPGQKL